VPKKEFLTTPSSGADQRLDLFLADIIKVLSRSQIQKLIEEGRVKINGQIQKSSHKLKVGDKVEIEYDLAVPEEIQPEKIPLDVLHKDDHLIVIVKPSGMVVHPGAGVRERTLVNALLYHFPDLEGVGPKERPGIVHRLDKETSGVMIIARSQMAYQSLRHQFRRREVEKIYIGLVWRRMPQAKGKITWAVGRHPRRGERFSIKTKKPRQAETRYSILKQRGEFTLLEIKPITGRTHQIRVHLAAAGHPLVGDRRYGGHKGKFRGLRLFLHAACLSLTHPETGKKIAFSSPLPSELKNFLDDQFQNSD